ncbi:CHAD domain-containing protein [Sinosporangium album]|uniref:CHAD domain-containing protein n=1 Tax=Sinosporangium album TaxID=504805 RepID=A0A1G8AH91_9ACTN|nr:CYTH and CHAD domain-containing protein [Sinosporangium album]SDH20318.1 CHAD domain-containing protein [Sinosporangium album]
MAIEIEDKFDVPTDFTVPDLSGISGCAQVESPVTHELTAIYFDTPDLRLAARGVTLRRRRGGDDAGWHLKLPKAKKVRQEITHRLTRSAKVVPAPLAELVTAYTRGGELVPVAELKTRRSVIVLKDEAGESVAEVADDSVKGTVFGEVPYVELWREVEVELTGGTEKLLGRVGKTLRKAGAVQAGAANKLRRLIDASPSAEKLQERPRPWAGEPGTAGAVVIDYVSSQVDALLAQDPQVRRAGDDAVHQMRVAARRLRSALKAFKSVMGETPEIQEELRWLGLVLGDVRDLEVIRARFAGRLEGLPPELVVGPVEARLGADLEAQEKAGYDVIRETLSDERYFALLDSLDLLVAKPSLTKKAASPAESTLTAVAARGWRRVERRYEEAQAMEDADEREIAMHNVRKAAKRARYTAEALAPVLGGTLAELGKRAEAVQDILGLHQDGVVAQEVLEREAERAREAGEDAFTYGVLIGIEREVAEQAHKGFPRVWEETVSVVRGLLPVG